MKWISRISFILAVIASVFFFTKYGEDNYLYNGDALGYYSYLPSAFCLHNLDSIDKFPADKELPAPVTNYFQMYPENEDVTPKGYYINQYTIGVAIFELPFFLVAHAYVLINGLDDSGYSIPYHTSIMCSTLFYALLGMFFCFKVVRIFYSRDMALFAVSIILLGSNLFWFSFVQMGMSHTILFFLVALLIYATIRFYEKHSIRWFYLVGLTLGFIMLTRPTDIVFGLIPLLYKVDSFSALKERFLFLWGLKWKLFLAIGIFFIPILPQMIFWKVYSGSFIYYSYNGQSFHFLKPKLWAGLFGPDNGWLLYSPIWILSIIALFRKHNLHGFKTATLILLPLYFYIIYSWECYQYINGFGSRPMLHIYPLLLIALVVLFDWIAHNKIAKILTTIALVFFVYHNLHYTYLNEVEKHWSQFSTHAFYKRMMFKNNLCYNDLVYRDIGIRQPDESSLKRVGDPLLLYTASDNTEYPRIFDAQLGDTVLRLPKGLESPNLKFDIPLEDAKSYSPNAFVKLSCVVKFPEFLGDPYRSLIWVHKFDLHGEQLSWNGLNVFSKMNLPNNRNLSLDSITMFNGAHSLWDTVTAFIPIEHNEEGLSSKLDFWNTAKTEFYLHSLRVEIFKKK